MSSVFPITDDPRYRRYTASADQTTFPVPFPFLQDEDLRIYLETAPSEYTLFPPETYTLSGAANPAGGTLTFNSPRTSGDIILILGEAILDRLSSIVRDGRFSSFLIDRELDRVKIIEQEFRRDAQRAIKVDYGGGGLTLASDLEDGDTIMKQGDRLVKGANATDIADAHINAVIARESKEAAEISAAQAQAAEEHAVEVTVTLQAEVTAAIDEMESKLEGAAEGYKVASTWAELSASTGDRSMQPGRVFASDTGTHTDPVVGGTVPNSGEYTWSSSPAGWRRVGDVIDEKFTDLLKESRENVLPYPGDTPMLSTNWLLALLGDGENVSAGFDVFGNLRAQIYDAPGAPVLSSSYAYAVTYSDGSLLFGFDHEGNLVLGALPVDTQVFTRNVGGVQRVTVVTSSGAFADITFGENNAYGPSLRGSYVRYAEDISGSLTLKSEEVIGATSLLSTVSKLTMVVVYGQSLSRGNSSTPAISTSDVLAGRAVMFNAGVRPRGTTDNTGALSADGIMSLVNLKETTTLENPGNQLGLSLGNALPLDEGILVASLGVGGQPYSSLKKGTTPYANVVMSLRRARIIAGLHGLDFEPPVLVWDQGQNNRADSTATYLGYLLELQADVTSDWQRYSGASGEVMTFLSQMSNWTATTYNLATCQVPLAQLQAAIDHPDKFAFICPQYIFTTSDGVHLAGADSAQYGAYIGRAIAAYKAGSPIRPLHIANAARTASTIVLTYEGCDEATDITLDTTLVSNPGNYGFEWKQTGGTAQTISGVSKTGAREITVTLSGDPGSPSASSIGYAVTGTPGANAGPTTGARGNVRDQSADITPLGLTMYHWAAHQLINL